jgi:hypothetical protein
MAVTVPSPPIIDRAATESVAVALVPPDVNPPVNPPVNSAVPITMSSSFCTRNATVPVGAAPPPGPIAPAPATVAVRRTLSFNPAVLGSTVSVVVLAVPRFHCVTSRKASTEPNPVARSYPVPAAKAMVLPPFAVVSTPKPPEVALLQSSAPPAQGTELFPVATSWKTPLVFASLYRL